MYICSVRAESTEVYYYFAATDKSVSRCVCLFLCVCVFFLHAIFYSSYIPRYRDLYTHEYYTTN